MDFEERKKHEEQCPSRPFKCPIPGCNVEVTGNSFVGHVKSLHAAICTCRSPTQLGNALSATIVLSNPDGQRNPQWHDVYEVPNGRR